MLHQEVEKSQQNLRLVWQPQPFVLPETFVPGYLRLMENGELTQRVSLAYQRLENCQMCAVRCGANRRSNKTINAWGRCRTGELARLSSYGPHMGEEDILRGQRGSGAVFFASCSLHCQFCQNFDISQTSAGNEIKPQGLASILLELQEYGCHNINFVTPEHVVPQVLAAVLIAAKKGLHIPLVYNSGGYDSLETLALLDGVFDIYMPDMKYSNTLVAKRYSKIDNYPEINREVVREMHRQVGDLKVDENGIAQRGLLVRHLVLPNGLAGTEEVVRFLAEEISPDTYLNIMSQYRPAFQAHLYASLNRPVTPAEYQRALELARRAGLTRLHGT